MIRTHEVGRAGVYLKGKVLVVATYLDGDRVDARAGTSVLREKMVQQRNPAETAHKQFIKIVTMAKQR